MPKRLLTKMAIASCKLYNSLLLINSLENIMLSLGVTIAKKLDKSVILERMYLQLLCRKPAILLLQFRPIP